MTRYVVDAQTATELRSAGERVELYDSEGHILGYFEPAKTVAELSEEDRRGPFTPDELQRRRKNLKGRPLAEILERLEREHP